MADLYSFDKAKSTKKPNFQQQLFSPMTGNKTAINLNQNAPMARPMTSIRAAGYSSRGRPQPNTASGGSFDPFNQGARNGPDSARRNENPEEQIKQTEKKVSQLIEESALASAEGNLQLALEKAKEAGKRERQLTKQREQLSQGLNLNDPNNNSNTNSLATPNLDLTYCVLLNLASCYHNCKMYQEALNSYSVIAKNKLFNQSGRLRVNMGNIYFEQHKYSQAIKMYRMALDQIPNTNKDIRLKITRNIGISFVKLGQYQDAITAFESIAEANSDYRAAFNLLLCYFALGDKDRMKKGFQKLVSIKPILIEQFDEVGLTSNNPVSSNVNDLRIGKEEMIEDHEVFNEDSLREITRERRKESERFIIFGAKLVAPNIEQQNINSSSNQQGSVSGSGYDWVVETIKNSPHSEIAFELEIAKAVQFLKSKEFTKAIDTLKSFEKKDQKMIGTAATNLSFLYILESDYKNAERYAEVAIANDRYNAKALTNMGNCYYYKGNHEKAKECYHEAVNVDALCVESMFNLGLVYKETNLYSEAIQWFEKLHSILRNSAEVIFQIADINDKMGNISQAMEWFNILISVVPTDPEVLAKMGDMYVKENDVTQAFQSYSESYRYFPSNLNVIAWLGAYYVDCEIYDQAVQFFERAALIQPSESKWQLMIASCFRRNGNYQKAFENYKKIHEKFPDNVECLRFLVRICTDLGMKDVHDYINKLAKAEKNKELTATENDIQTEVKSGTPGFVKYEVEKIDTNISHPKANLQKKQTEFEEDWNEDINSLLP